jgi:hypothetical protein
MNLRVIPTEVHGGLDYLASGINLVFPGLLGLHDAPWAVLVPRVDGVAGTYYSLITDYELGALKVLPMPAHLAFDAAKGAFMAFSPWLFGFAKNGPRYWLPHVEAYSPVPRRCVLRSSHVPNCQRSRLLAR